MQKPYSVRNQPWSEFNKQSYHIFKDDFVHNKLFSIKTHLKSDKGQALLKGEVTEKLDNFKVHPSIQLWFPLWINKNQQLFFKSKQGKIKLHYDHGLNEIVNNNLFKFYNFYASYNGKNNFSLSVFKTGVDLLTKTFYIDNRIRLQFQSSQHRHVTTGHKIGWANDKWSVDFLQIWNWNHLSIVQNAIRLGYRKQNYDLFLRAINHTHRNIKHLKLTNLDTYFTNFTFDFVKRINDLTRIGIQSQFTKTGIVNTSFVFQKSSEGKEKGLKVKVSTDQGIAVCYQAIIENYGKCTIGLELSDLGKNIQCKYGIHFDVNL